MKLKLDDDGHVVVADGKPVYVHDDGKEMPFDAAATVATITRLNGEAKGHREAKEAFEARLKAFEGIDDAEAARKAMETVANLGSGDLKTAAQVEEIKREAKTAAEKQVAEAAKVNANRIKELEDQLGKVTSEYDGEKVSNAFASSKFIRENVAVPLDMVQAMFGQRFKREDGRLVGYDSTGNKIYSRSKPGELADFDEAIQMTIDAYPNREMVLKSSAGSGAGTDGNNAAPRGARGQKTMKRTEFDRLDPTGQRNAIAERTVITD